MLEEEKKMKKNRFAPECIVRPADLLLLLAAVIEWNGSQRVSQCFCDIGTLIINSNMLWIFRKVVHYTMNKVENAIVP